MSRVCHETEDYIQNPFYVMNAVLRGKKGRLAVSNLEVSLCAETTRRLSLKDLPTSPQQMEEDIFYAIEQAEGTEGGFTGAVQLCGGYDKNGNIRYVSRDLASSKLPTSARDLLTHPEWVELVDGKYKAAKWAETLYRKLQK